MSLDTNNITDARISPVFRALFNYADKTSSLDLEDWISILTLCFSPLIAHIVAGVPTVVRRCPKPPSWLDTLCLYNPTTILWRYLAIADRRARHSNGSSRTGSWTAADMAASNALFWTSHGFDGSEEMMRESRAFCTRTPQRNRTELWSTDSLKTVIITLQGIQAVVVLVQGILAIAGVGNRPFNATVAMDSIFYPLSVLGLLRLFAAPWLTEAYSYAEYDGFEEGVCLTSPNQPLMAGGCDTGSKQAHPTPTSSMTLPAGDPNAYSSSQTGRTRAAVLCISYVLLVCCMLAISVCYIVPIKYPHADALLTKPPSSSVLWLLAFLYIFFSASSVILFSTHLLRRGGKTTTVVIPCIGTWWYRTYTLTLLAAMIVLIVLSGVYTRRTACGKLTVFPPPFDQQVCNGTPVGAHEAGLGPVGLVVRNPGLSPPNWVLGLQGWCSGTLTGEISPVVSVG